MLKLFNVEAANYVGTHPCTTFYPLAKLFGPTKGEWDNLQDPGFATSQELLLMILKQWPHLCLEYAKPLRVSDTAMGYTAHFSNNSVMFDMMKTNNNLRENAQLPPLLKRKNRKLRSNIAVMIANMRVGNTSHFPAQPPGTLFKNLIAI